LLLVFLAAASPAAAGIYDLGPGAWSYFGDPRSIAHGDDVFTGWISTTGDVWVSQRDVRTGRLVRRRVYRALGVDDHNNPSLVWWHGRLVAFFSEHSGVYLGHGARMRYRVARSRHSLRGGFGPLRFVTANVPGTLGFTYPNPVVSGGRLYLMFRGNRWTPTITSTRDGVHWARARELIRGPYRAEKPQRPYAKYAAAPDGSIGMVFSDAHVESYENSLYYARFDGRRFVRADGTRIGTLRDLPLPRSRLDVVYRYSNAGGRAWPHDVAFGADGRPVIAYTRRTGGPLGTDAFHYARFDGRRWLDRRLASAGAGARTFRSGGISLDHADPSRLVLSRAHDGPSQVEAWSTADGGGTWSATPLTSRADAFSIRPVIPRGYTRAGRLVVVYVTGTADSYLSYRTRVVMQVGRWTSPATRSVSTPPSGPAG
jgi:hypothetical protein